MALHLFTCRMSGRHSTRGWLARFGLGALAMVVAVILASLAYELWLPGVANAEVRTASILQAHHGTLGGLPIPAKLGMAVVAVEDEHFYSNVVVNILDGVGRAALATLQYSGDPGGSTIAQQLAKQLYRQGTGFSASLRELAMGVKLSLTYSHQAILAMYLNSIYYGNHSWGDVAAAQDYFGLSPDRLDWAQATMLAGLPQAPSSYDPLQHFALAKERQHHVLDQLVANHVLSAAAARSAFHQPLDLFGTRAGGAA